MDTVKSAQRKGILGNWVTYLSVKIARKGLWVLEVADFMTRMRLRGAIVVSNDFEGRVGGGLADEGGIWPRLGFGDKQDGRAGAAESYAENAGSVRPAAGVAAGAGRPSMR
jgi:hypothetical protein